MRCACALRSACTPWLLLSALLYRSFREGYWLTCTKIDQFDKNITFCYCYSCALHELSSLSKYGGSEWLYGADPAWRGLDQRLSGFQEVYDGLCRAKEVLG